MVVGVDRPGDDGDCEESAGVEQQTSAKCFLQTCHLSPLAEQDEALVGCEVETQFTQMCGVLVWSCVLCGSLQNCQVRARVKGYGRGWTICVSSVG